MNIPVTDHGASLTLHFHEGDYILHTSNAGRPHGRVVEGTVAPRTVRGKDAGYTLLSVKYENGVTWSQVRAVQIDRTLIAASRVA